MVNFMDNTPTSDELILIRQWYKFNNRIRKFQNNFNMELSIDVFGEEGDRLFRHFRTDCDGRYEKFITYLLPQESNDLLVHIARHSKYN